MKLKLLTVVGLMGFSLLSACNKENSPDVVASEVAATRQKAAVETANAQRDASKDNAAAADKLDDKSRDLNNVEAKGAYDVAMAMAKADGDHKVALEKCTAMSGDAQSKCKDVADANYNVAKANAKATEVATKQ
jgi:hypothetical protein